MNFIESKIEGLFLIESKLLTDNRGSFSKVFHKSTFDKVNSDLNFQESYYSISQKDVIRGMHFQVLPEDHSKLVYVPKGQILDVVLDLRMESKTYGQYSSFILSDSNANSLLIPKGCAHGFKSLEDDTITVYAVTSEYNSQCDSGVRWDSFGFDWDNVNPILSDRDNELIPLNKFITPFL
ncbi:MAG: dTDP-4-dehydrorhamnose 3,5-epimerase family protein [Reichenbachiella sp.]